MKLALVAPLFALVLLAADPAEKEFKALHGAWTVVAAERDGQPFDLIKGGTMTIKDQNFHIVTKAGTELKGDLRLDPAKKPKRMDLAHQAGPLRDKTWEAIYELDGDDFKLCYAEIEAGKERPTEFKTAQDSGHLLVVLKREKK